MTAVLEVVCCLSYFVLASHDYS